MDDKLHELNIKEVCSSVLALGFHRLAFYFSEIYFEITVDSPMDHFHLEFWYLRPGHHERLGVK